MTHAVIPVIHKQPSEASQAGQAVFQAMIPCAVRRGLCGMGMTEKQGVGHFDANTTYAVALMEPVPMLLCVRYKWFCSAPMSTTPSARFEP